MNSNISIWVVYKLATILVGLVFVYFGYKLLIKGIFDSSSDVTAAWDNNKKLIIKRASPGVLFALFGFGIIVINVALSNYTFSSQGGGIEKDNSKNIMSEVEQKQLSFKNQQTDNGTASTRIITCESANTSEDVCAKAQNDALHSVRQLSQRAR